MGKAGCLQRLLEIAAMRAARCVDDIERPDSKEAGEIYAWLSFGGVHGERFSAYYHGAPFSRAATAMSPSRVGMGLLVSMMILPLMSSPSSLPSCGIAV